MRRALRIAVPSVLVLLPLLGLGAIAARAETPTKLFDCPGSLGQVPLVFGVYDVADPVNSGIPDAHGLWQSCTYNGNIGTSESVGEYFVTAFWGNATSGAETFFCANQPLDGIIEKAAPDFQGATGSLASADHRAFVVYGADPASSLPAVEGLARQMLQLAEGKAAICPGVHAPAAGPGSEGSSGPSGSRAAGTAMAVAGVATTLVAGVGSLLAGKGGKFPPGVPATPPLERLYSGDDAIRMLGDAGLLVELHDPGGAFIGYRPRGDLDAFIRKHPEWQPEFSSPFPTPNGGRATHLAGVAFQSGPEGTVRSITVIVREAAGSPQGAPASVATPAGAPAAPDAPQPPGRSLASQLLSVYMGPGFAPEAGFAGAPARLPRPPAPPAPPEPPSLADMVYKGSIEKTVEGIDPDAPISKLYRPAPAAPAHPAQPPTAQAEVPARPPADPGQFHRWLTAPGDKTITAGDLHALAPKLLGKGGTVKSGLYAGGRASAVISDGSVKVTVTSPDSLLGAALPDIETTGTLAAKGGRIVASIPGSAPDSMVTKAVQEHLDRVNHELGQAGMRVDALKVQNGEIRLLVGRAN